MSRLQKQTTAILEDLERRLDAAVEDDLATQWEDFLFGRFDGDLFTSYRKAVTQPGIPLPEIHINDAINDVELMLLSQLADASRALSTRTSNPCIRANYGTGILSSLFGAELYIMPRDMHTLPTTRQFGSTDRIRALLDQGIPSLTGGLGQRVFDFAELQAEAFAPYPLVQKYVEVYHPDVQGPLDIAELMWGGEMFYAMYDEPELVHALLDLISNTYTAFLEKWFPLCPDKGAINSHWSQLRYRGHIVLRDDSAMNLTPQFYKEYAFPYDARLLAHYGGGVVQFCGRGDHYIEALCAIPHLTGINLSQPELNDMERIYRCTVDKGIKLLSFSREYAQKSMNRPGELHHNVHC